MTMTMTDVRLFLQRAKKQYGPRCELLYTDTDSLLLEIKKDDVYLGKMKDECAETPIAECVCLRLKMYSILKADEKKYQKSKECKKERCQETNNARTVQGNAFWYGAVMAWNEHSSKRVA